MTRVDRKDLRRLSSQLSAVESEGIQSFTTSNKPCLKSTVSASEYKESEQSEDSELVLRFDEEYKDNYQLGSE